MYDNETGVYTTFSFSENGKELKNIFLSVYHTDLTIIVIPTYM